MKSKMKATAPAAPASPTSAKAPTPKPSAQKLSSARNAIAKRPLRPRGKSPRVDSFDGASPLSKRAPTPARAEVPPFFFAPKSSKDTSDAPLVDAPHLRPEMLWGPIERPVAQAPLNLALRYHTQPPEPRALKKTMMSVIPVLYDLQAEARHWVTQLGGKSKLRAQRVWGLDEHRNLVTVDFAPRDGQTSENNKDSFLAESLELAFQGPAINVVAAQNRRLYVRELLDRSMEATGQHYEGADPFSACRMSSIGATRSEWGTTPDAYLSVEAAHLGSLGSMLERMQVADAHAVALSVGVQVGYELAHLHARGLVHLDVTPRSIHFLPSGRAMLARFDALQLLSLDGNTPSGPVYRLSTCLAPEMRASSDRAVTNNVSMLTPAVDIFQLSITLLEVLGANRSVVHGNTSDRNGPRGSPYLTRRAIYLTLKNFVGNFLHDRVRYLASPEEAIRKRPGAKISPFLQLLHSAHKHNAKLCYQLVLHGLDPDPGRRPSAAQLTNVLLTHFDAQGSDASQANKACQREFARQGGPQALDLLLQQEEKLSAP